MSDAPSPAASSAELWACVEDLAGARVLIAGDVMVDHFVYGVVERISPEAPVPVLRGAEVTQMLGGAGNVAANVRALRATPTMIALVGDDRDADDLRELCRAEGIGDDGLVVAPGRRTAVKSRFVAQQQQLLRFDSETTAPPDAVAARALLARFGEALAGADLVVLSDYGKGVLDAGASAAMIAAATAAGRTVLVDPKGADYTRYRGAAYVTPNLKELREASGLAAEDDAGVVEAARALIVAHGFEAVLVTRSKDGMSVVRAHSALHIPTEAQEVFDVSGAGDTVVATAALRLARGGSLEEAARMANAAAGVVVAKLGTAKVTPDELRAALRPDGRHARVGARQNASPGRVDLATAIRAVEAWRERGLRVGFTNGCFDLIHAGHVSLLGQAREACDRLVVGLNGDASVRRLKGASRPLNVAADRAAVLAGLRDVDLVVLFDEDTPEALVRALRPDVLVKGADYAGRSIAGAAFVESTGGRVVLADLAPGRSTTALAAKLAAGGAHAPSTTSGGPPPPILGGGSGRS